MKGSPGTEGGGACVPGSAQSSVMLYNMLAKSILSKLFRSTFQDLSPHAFFSYQKCTAPVMPPLPIHVIPVLDSSVFLQATFYSNSCPQWSPHFQTPMSLFSLEEEPILGLIIVTGLMPLTAKVNLGLA